MTRFSDVFAGRARFGLPVMASLVILLLTFGSLAAQWSDDFRLTSCSLDAKTCYNNGWSLAPDAAGRVHVAWADGRLGANADGIFYKVYSPSAGWSADSQLTATGNVERLPTGACDPSGNFYIAWQRTDSFSAQQIRYRKHGVATGWGAIEEITPSLSNYSRFAPSLVAQGNDTVYAVWHGYGPNSPNTYDQIYYRRRISTGWEPAETLTSGSYKNYYPSVALDVQNNVHVAWFGSSIGTPNTFQIIRYRRRTGAGWDTTEVVSSSATTKNVPSIAVDKFGDVHVVWYQQDGSYYQVYYARRTTSGWSAPLALTSGSYANNGPSIAVDTLGRVRVVWYGRDAGSPSTTQLYHKLRDTGGAWQATQQLTGATGGSRERALVRCDRKLDHHVIWMDSRDGNMELYYKGPVVRDVGAVRIRVPSGVEDSTGMLTPQAIVRNYSSRTETLTVRMRIGSSYNATATAIVPTQRTDTVDLPGWTVGPRGTYATVCTVAINGDANPANDRVADSAIVQVRDVGVTRVVAPAGVVDSGTTLTPSVWVRNFGSRAETFTTGLRIVGAGYANAQSRTLSPGDSVLINTFSAWTNARPRGMMPVRCSTMLSGDVVPGNNRVADSVFVRVQELGLLTFYSPASGTYNAGVVIQCTSRIRNTGNTTATYQAKLRIGDPPGFWNDSIQTTLGPGKDSTIRFRDWTVDSVGTNHPVRCTVALAGDVNAANNAQTHYVTVRAHDVLVTAILAPTGTFDSGATAVPRAVVRNVGIAAEIFPLVMRIGSAGFYVDSVRCTLAIGQTDTLTFRAWDMLQRGSQPLRCTAALVGDNLPGNNALTSWVHVRVRDAAPVTISAPAGQVDSGRAITPSAQILNRGTGLETLYVRMKISSGYNATSRVIVAAGATANCNFTPVTFTSRTVYTTSCSTELANDRIADNDRVVGACSVRVVDAAVMRVLGPNGSIDSAGTATPRAWVRNLGSQAVTFNAVMRIGAYSSSVPQTLNPDDSALVTFAPWTAVARGRNLVRCSTALTGDLVAGNNRRVDSVLVLVHDMAAQEILEPGANVAESALVVPRVIVANPGNTSQQFRARVRIVQEGGGSVYLDSVTGTLAAGVTDTIQFASWLAFPYGYFQVSAVVASLDDQNPVNDSVARRILVLEVTTRDVSSERIVQPTGTIFPGQVYPRAEVKNRGEAFESFWTYLRIRNETGPVYFDSVEVIALGPGEPETLSFHVWTATSGNFVARCSTGLRNDNVPGNDTLNLSFQVDSAAPGAWTAMTDVPAGSKGKTVKTGGSLAAVGDSLIYAVKGNNRDEFYVYNIRDNVWATRESVPAIGRSGKKKRPNKGASLAYSPGNHSLYLLKGNSTLELWSYSIDSHAWRQRADMPIGPLGKTLKGGSALRFDPGSGVFYAVKGSKTLEFYVYDPAADIWTTRTPVPTGVSGKPVGDGGTLVSHGGALYALKGNNLVEFYRYDPGSDVWTSQPDFPLGIKRKKVKDGAALASDNTRSLYALKGNNRLEFYNFDPTAHYWSSRPDLPAGTGRRVKGGGSLAYAQGRVYALKGNSTLEFWRFEPGSVSGANAQTAGTARNANRFTLDLGPTPARNMLDIRFDGPQPAVARLFDINGRALRRWQLTPSRVTRVALRGLAAGVYIVQVGTPDGQLTRKVVIE